MPRSSCPEGVAWNQFSLMCQVCALMCTSCVLCPPVAGHGSYRGSSVCSWRHLIWGSLRAKSEGSWGSGSGGSWELLWGKTEAKMTRTRSETVLKDRWVG